MTEDGPEDTIPVSEPDDVLDPALVGRIAEWVGALCSGDPDARQAADAQLVAVGAPALNRLLFAMSDIRLPLDARVRAGTLVGQIGDPRLGLPHALGPFVRVTSGNFRMGAKPLEPDATTNALPQHDVDLASYAIGRYPVTNVAFRAFIEDGGYAHEEWWLADGWQWRGTSRVDTPHYWQAAARKPNHPVTGISWFESCAFCQWLTLRLAERGDLRPGEVIRLPTEAEWEKAARGGVTLDRRRSQPNNMPERRFPWGDAFLANMGNTAEGGLGGTSPVGMFPDGASPYKIDDLGGNVLEWCSSRPGAYPYHANDGRELPAGGSRAYRVARGGAWAFGADSARCAYRHWNRADFRGGMIGLRVVQGYPLP
jgi:formylglycine-generating enzyme required for sulfatase activity